MARAAARAEHPRLAMKRTAYVLLADAADRARIDGALARCVDRIVFLGAIDELPAHPAGDEANCLILSAEPPETDAVKTIDALRRHGNGIPVIALGSHAAFRQAVHIARMDATDVLERPVSDRELQQAVRRMCRARP